MTLNKNDVLTLVTIAVEEQGPGHVAGCRYLDDNGAPVCIVANIFEKAGLTHLLVEGEIVADLPIADEVTPGAKHLLSLAQVEADIDNTWGEALQAVREYFDEITEDGEFIDA